MIEASIPSTSEVQAITAIPDPVIRNLRITECYHRLSRAFTARTGTCANWCTFATWASRQAGCTIRGEDLHTALSENTRTGFVLRHPVHSFWRWLLRKGLFRPETFLGRIVRDVHTPFDALERASDAVARGNRKVFEEIGFEFARYLETCPPTLPVESSEFQSFLVQLRSGDPPEGQDYLKHAFTRYQLQHFDTDPYLRAQRTFLANVEIGLHEQNRLQPEIRESLESGPRTAEDLGMRTLQALHPAAQNWRQAIRRPVAALLGPIARSLAKFNRDLACRIVTEALMTLDLPMTRLALGQHLDREPSPLLMTITDDEVRDVMAGIEPAPGLPDDCGASDWSDLRQRMHFIVHLFRAFHEHRELLDCPFSAQQVRAIEAGQIPRGRL